MVGYDIETLTVVEKVLTQVEKVRFTPTKKDGEYTGKLAHEWAMSNDFGLRNWLVMRHIIDVYGEDRKFYNSTFRYMDHNDYTYWVMPQWVKPNWADNFDYNDNYVLNRQRITDETYAGSQI